MGLLALLLAPKREGERVWRRRFIETHRYVLEADAKWRQFTHGAELRDVDWHQWTSPLGWPVMGVYLHGKLEERSMRRT